MMVGKYSTTVSLHVKSADPRMSFILYCRVQTSMKMRSTPWDIKSQAWKDVPFRGTPRGIIEGENVLPSFQMTLALQGQWKGKGRVQHSSNKSGMKMRLLKRCEVTTPPVRRPCLNGRSLQDIWSICTGGYEGMRYWLTYRTDFTIMVNKHY